MQGNDRPNTLAVQPDAPQRPLTPSSSTTTPKSAIIAIPPEWNVEPGDTLAPSPFSNTSRQSHDYPQHRSAISPSSPTSMINPHFAWPGSLSSSSSSSAFPGPDRTPDPFDSRSTSSEDHLHPSSSSSSEDEIIPHHPPPAPYFNEQRRPSVVFIPHHIRSATDSNLVTAVDAEFSAAAQPLEGYDFATDTNPPKFGRTFSAPLPNRVGYLRHPLVEPPSSGSSSHRSSLDSNYGQAQQPATPESEASSLSTLSLEMADSLQSAIQTLIHLSPPHLLDNAKEQYSGCTVQMPTTSLSALLTSMRGLNYLSANVQDLCHALESKGEDGLLAKARKTEDFDVGELAQNVADLLGGQAAQAGVDLVLFHGDVGIKHISANGDVEGLGYLLSHIIRQILLVASSGDTIEIGLQIVPQSPSLTPRVSAPLSAADADKNRKTSVDGIGQTLAPSSSSANSGPVLCVFEIVHNIAQPSNLHETPKAELNPFSRLVEEKEAAMPKLDTILCRRLLAQQHATLKQDIVPSSPMGSGLPRKAFELSVLLPRGKPIDEIAKLSAEEEAVRQPFAGVRLAREPTLGELSDFAEHLRGKKVFLHASLGSLFARHLTSYLAAWGLDISHIPLEEEETSAAPSRQDSGLASSVSTTPADGVAAGLASLSLGPRDTDKFIIIDDDVAILKRELLRLCSDITLLKPRLTKRPTLGSRTRSTPHFRPPTNVGKPKAPVLIHFTSIANYNQVRDVIASVFGPPWSNRDGAFSHPEVMVIPKPVGPRRFLTALHTAVNQPLIDPSFSPIATTPRSPSGGHFWSGGRTPLGNEIPRDGFFDSVAEESTDPATAASSNNNGKSPMGENPPAERSNLPLPTSEIVSTPALEYFSTSRSASGSGAAGTIIQSPDGRFGIQFEPPVKGERRASYSRSGDGSRRKTTSRRTSNAPSEPPSVNVSPTAASPQSARRPTASSALAENPSSSTQPPREKQAERPHRRRTLPLADRPLVVQGRDRSSTITRNTPSPNAVPGSPVAPTPPKASPSNGTTTTAVSKKKKKKDEVVVPPINVLIVEDNPINQNILSMFLRKKKIKHQSAKDGVEAVEKWKTGGFHLILMDIQLPVMDGITATRKIRELEKKSNIGIYPSTPVGEPARFLDSTIPSSPLRSSVIIVALTASSLHTDRVNALGAGCNDFLTKPVSLKWLEKKIVEWGCMQALIDFDGWKRWKGSDGRDTSETKRGFSLGPQAAARNVADRLRIERKQSPARQQNKEGTTSRPKTPDSLGGSSLAQSMQMSPAQSLVDARDDLVATEDKGPEQVSTNLVTNPTVSIIHPTDSIPSMAVDPASQATSLESIHEAVEPPRALPP